MSGVITAIYQTAAHRTGEPGELNAIAALVGSLTGTEAQLFVLGGLDAMGIDIVELEKLAKAMGTPLSLVRVAQPARIVPHDPTTLQGAAAIICADPKLLERLTDTYNGFIQSYFLEDEIRGILRWDPKEDGDQLRALQTLQREFRRATEASTFYQPRKRQLCPEGLRAIAERGPAELE